MPVRRLPCPRAPDPGCLARVSGRRAPGQPPAHPVAPAGQGRGQGRGFLVPPHAGHGSEPGPCSSLPAPLRHPSRPLWLLQPRWPRPWNGHTLATALGAARPTGRGLETPTVRRGPSSASLRPGGRPLGETEAQSSRVPSPGPHPGQRPPPAACSCPLPVLPPGPILFPASGDALFAIVFPKKFPLWCHRMTQPESRAARPRRRRAAGERTGGGPPGPGLSCCLTARPAGGRPLTQPRAPGPHLPAVPSRGGKGLRRSLPSEPGVSPPRARGERVLAASCFPPRGAHREQPWGPRPRCAGRGTDGSAWHERGPHTSW